VREPLAGFPAGAPADCLAVQGNFQAPPRRRLIVAPTPRPKGLSHHPLKKHRMAIPSKSVHEPPLK
jgi:hypothetical protein